MPVVDPAAEEAQSRAFLELYDTALPQVFGYLRARSGSEPLAEDLTTETFLAAVRSYQQRPGQELSTGWVIAVARNKLVDHWRKVATEERHLQLVADRTADQQSEEDEWIDGFGGTEAHAVLAGLAAQHRLALTLRYVDDLSVPEVARLLERTVQATETLLVRARRAFRQAYVATDQEGGDHAR